MSEFSFIKTEHEIMNFWKNNNIFQKSLEKTKDGAPFIFYDGPPFATGLPHHGHLLASTLKDIVPRYFTMKGRHVTRRWGWDCHGLPVEHEIDKKLGLSAQEAVEKLGVKGYNDECRSIVQKYTSEWKEVIDRLGRFVDFENDYKTMDVNFMESVWWVFKSLWDKGYIYQGTKVMPFSTQMGTILSNFEAGLNYQDVQDPAITVLFKLENDERYIAAWTTTPWTLPSNLGLCVGPEIDYVEVKDVESGKTIIMGKDRVESYYKKRDYSIGREFKGSELKGMKYAPLFPYFKELVSEGAFVILNDSYVTTESGTGIVHIAPSFGEDDNRVMKEAGLNLVACPVGNNGHFTKEVTDFFDIYVKDADKAIIKKLKSENKLFEQSTYVHSYPFCYRSNTPLIYKAIPSWYVKVEKIVDQLLKSNEQINWVPGHIKKGRFGKWLAGARDWAISRNRVWGTPLPIWKNETTGNFICIGSVDELEKFSGVKVEDLHREFVDDITFKINGEEGEYKRITEVLDCWFESGSMPYAQLHYPFENKEIFDAGFPAEFIAEGLDQTRGWFYTLTILSTALFGKPAFKNVIVNGMVLAEDGKKMSKSLRNFTPPADLMEKYGADALRLYLINSGLVKGEEQRFTNNGVKEMVRKALLPWLSSYNFFATYAKIDGWKKNEHFLESTNITDKWIISNLQTLKKKIDLEMAEYKLYNVVPHLFTFIEDLTNWYIRLNRSRFWANGMDNDKKMANSTLFTVLKELSLIMAPFTPFLSEHLYHKLAQFTDDLEESVHLDTYPKAKNELIDERLEEAVSRMQQVILLGRQKRTAEKIKIKTPLARLTVINTDQALLDDIKNIEEYIKSELNIKEVQYTSDESKYVKLFAKPNSPVLGKRLGKDFGKLMGAVKGLKSNDIAKYENNGTINIGDITLGEGDLFVFREALEGTETVSNRLIAIDLDLNLTEELIIEGLAREVVGRIQNLRKSSGFEVSDRIKLNYKASEKLKKAITTHYDQICKEVLADSITESNVEINEEKIDEESIFIGISKS